MLAQGEANEVSETLGPRRKQDWSPGRATEPTAKDPGLRDAFGVRFTLG
jgi:hypothetical protein